MQSSCRNVCMVDIAAENEECYTILKMVSHSLFSSVGKGSKYGTSYYFMEDQRRH